MGCSNDSKKEEPTNNAQTAEKTDLEKVSEALTLTVEKTDSRSNVIIAKDNDGN